MSEFNRAIHLQGNMEEGSRALSAKKPDLAKIEGSEEREDNEMPREEGQNQVDIYSQAELRAIELRAEDPRNTNSERMQAMKQEKLIKDQQTTFARKERQQKAIAAVR